MLCFMMMGLKGRQLCDLTILHYLASTDKQTDGQGDSSVSPLTSLRGGGGGWYKDWTRLM